MLVAGILPPIAKINISASYFTAKGGGHGGSKHYSPAKKLANAAILPNQIHQIQQYILENALKTLENLKVIF